MARWIPRKPGYVYACSNCKTGMLVTAKFRDGVCVTTDTGNATPYCPFCGERMDGEEDG